MKVDRPFSESELDFLKNNIGVLSNLELAKSLNRTSGSISSAISRYEIKRELILLEGEEIKPIFGGKYQITNFGRIFNRLNLEMNTYFSEGYRRITLSPIKGKKEKFFVHRLVAENFLERVDGANFINHKDMNRENNHVSNLEWITQSDNEKHKFLNRPELREHLSLLNRKADNPEKERVLNEVNEICRLLKEGKKVYEIAKITGVYNDRISAIKNKRLWKSISDKYF